MDTKVLIFDSGKGGEFVLQAAKKRFPDVTFDFLADTSGLPYGNKTEEQIVASATNALTPVVTDYDFVIIACHTLTEVGIEQLRQQFPDTTFIGFDPGIKMAKNTGNERICVLATPASISSDRYTRLKKSLAFEHVDEPDCSSWAEAIENGSFDIQEAENAINQSECDAVVLACTHYFWYEDDLRRLFPEKTVLNPTQAVLDQFERLLTSSRNSSPR